MTLRLVHSRPPKPEPQHGYDRAVGIDDDLEDFESEHLGLVHRLRTMKWPELGSDLRERCWREFQRRTAGDVARVRDDESPRSD